MKTQTQTHSHTHTKTHTATPIAILFPLSEGHKDTLFIHMGDNDNASQLLSFLPPLALRFDQLERQSGC